MALFNLEYNKSGKFMLSLNLDLVKNDVRVMSHLQKVGKRVHSVVTWVSYLGVCYDEKMAVFKGNFSIWTKSSEKRRISRENRKNLRFCRLNIPPALQKEREEQGKRASAIVQKMDMHILAHFKHTQTNGAAYCTFYVFLLLSFLVSSCICSNLLIQETYYPYSSLGPTVTRPHRCVIPR